MAYILSAQRDRDAPAQRLWREYVEYLHANRTAFPPGAFALATSDWYYGSSDPRAPHDAWLEWARFEEPALGARQEVRALSLRVRLLGAYHDNYLEFFYPQVYSYTLTHNTSDSGHGDWRYDEFRLSSRGHLIHEIEWTSAPGSEARWLIEASDVRLTIIPRTGV